MGKIRNAENGAEDIIKVSHGDVTSVKNNVSRFVYDDVDDCDYATQLDDDMV